MTGFERPEGFQKEAVRSVLVDSMQKLKGAKYQADVTANMTKQLSAEIRDRLKELDIP